MIREAKREDLAELLELYLFLHEDSIPEMNRKHGNRFLKIPIII